MKENPQGFERFGAQWTPTVIIADAAGTERYRFEGYLPAEDFLAQLGLGLAKLHFAQGDWTEAEQRFRGVLERHPDSDVAAEALYWAGVSRYKATGDASALQQTAQAFQSRYRDSGWAKKASVWAA
jgi:outer membrane protein assembly factor BamD (BamD/ComL family)